MTKKFPLIARFSIVVALLLTFNPIKNGFTVQASQSANLIVNGDFETGKAAPWTGLSDDQVVSTDAHSGNYAARITAGEAQQLWFPVQAGTPYELSVWYKWTAYSGSDWGYDRIRVVNNDWGEAGSLRSMHKSVPKGEWRQLKLTFTPSTDSVGLVFGMFGPQDTVELFFDDFSLQPLNASAPTPTSGANLLVNGDFESGKVEPWSDIDATQLVSTGAHGGKYAVKITSGKEARQIWLPVTPGKTYEFAGWYKWVEYQGSDWGYDRMRVVHFDWSEAASLNNLHRSAPQNQWTEFKTTFTAKTGQVGVSFGMFGPQEVVEIYFDDLSLRETNGAAPTQAPTAPPAATSTPTQVLPPPATPTQTPPAPTTAPELPPAGIGPANGDFESGKAAPWTGISDAHISSSRVHSGKYAVKITAGEAQQLWLPVTPGKPYELVLWYQWAAFQGDDWGYDRVRVVNNDWSEAGSMKFMHRFYPQNQWNELKVAFTPTTDRVGIIFGLFGPQNTVELYFDDIQLREAGASQPTLPPEQTPTTAPVEPTTTGQAPTLPPAQTPTAGPPPVELIQNGGFEAGASSWEGLTDAMLSSQNAYSGSRAVQITSQVELQQGWLAVTPGKTYTLTTWFKWTEFAGSDWGYERVRLVDYNWGGLAQIARMHKLYPKDQWNKLAITFTPQVDKVRVLFGMFGPQERVNLYFDDFSLTESSGSIPPELTINASPTSGAAPLKVSFTSQASDPDGAVQRYHWDFGDGSSDTSANPSHTYLGGGVFEAKCTVWDNQDNATTRSLQIKVDGDPTSAVQIASPTSDGTFTTTDASIVLKGTASAATRVAWDNVDTGQAGLIESGAPIDNWQTPSIRLKPGRNEILITAMNAAGKPGTARLVVSRRLSAPAISNIQLSSTGVKKFEKVEVTFDLLTVAENYFYEYDPNPPAGVKPGVGVTVEGVFTSPSGKTLVQPGYYTTDAVRLGGTGLGRFEQTNRSYWAVRFSPQETGAYSVSLRVRDAFGSTEKSAGSFTAGSSSNAGYIRVSASDPRYFEFTNGALFWPNGPANGPDYSQYRDTGMNLHRQWLGGIGAYTTNFARWISTAKDMGNEGYDSQLSFREHYPGHELSQEVFYPGGQRIWIGWLNGAAYAPNLKANATYQVKARIKTLDISGPVDPAFPYGFMIKAGGWPSQSQEVDMRDRASFIPPVTQNSDWFTVVAKLNTNGNMKLGPYLYLFLDNVKSGRVYIDEVSIREMLGDGNLGGEQVVNARADLHTYVEPGAAAAIDYQVEQAEQNGVYLKYVVHDKRDWIQNHLTRQGNFADSGNGYYQQNGTRAHWLLEQWWRYLAARWGYSTAIHSWELNNEGPPSDSMHWALAQDFARYMHQIDAHPHLVSTSFWSEWKPEFWGDNNRYPDIDYADIHEYVSDKSLAYDVVGWAVNTAQTVFNSQVQKPTLRGEVGLGGPSADFFKTLSQPNSGDWFHDLTWSALTPGALYNPNYWWGEHRKQIPIEQISKAFHQFVKDLDLNKGGYQDAATAVSNTNLIAIGQKNTAANTAHLWIQNKAHTWRNVMGIDGAQTISAQSGTVTIKLNPNIDYKVDWWDTSTGQISSSQTVRSDSSGNLKLSISNLQADIAVKIRR